MTKVTTFNSNSSHSSATSTCKGGGNGESDGDCTTIIASSDRRFSTSCVRNVRYWKYGKMEEEREKEEPLGLTRAVVNTAASISVDLTKARPTIELNPQKIIRNRAWRVEFLLNFTVFPANRRR